MICALWVMIGVASFALGYAAAFLITRFIEQHENGEN